MRIEKLKKGIIGTNEFNNVKHAESEIQVTIKKEDSGRILLSRLKKHFEDTGIKGALSGQGKLMICRTVYREGNSISKQITSGFTGNWTSEDFIHFERKCKEELK